MEKLYLIKEYPCSGHSIPEIIGIFSSKANALERFREDILHDCAVTYKDLIDDECFEAFNVIILDSNDKEIPVNKLHPTLKVVECDYNYHTNEAIYRLIDDPKIMEGSEFSQYFIEEINCDDWL